MKELNLETASDLGYSDFRNILGLAGLLKTPVLKKFLVALKLDHKIPST
jgi:hypothetical protein